MAYSASFYVNQQTISYKISIYSGWKLITNLYYFDMGFPTVCHWQGICHPWLVVHCANHLLSRRIAFKFKRRYKINFRWWYLEYSSNDLPNPEFERIASAVVCRLVWRPLSSPKAVDQLLNKSTKLEYYYIVLYPRLQDCIFRKFSR